MLSNMKAFKTDFDGNKFVKVTYDVKHEYDFTNEPATNLVDSDNTHNCNEEIVDERIRKLNEDYVKRLDEFSDPCAVTVKTYKECNRYFILPYSEYMWFRWRSLKPPARCYKCRDKRKKMR